MANINERKPYFARVEELKAWYRLHSSTYLLEQLPHMSIKELVAKESVAAAKAVLAERDL
jgi:hypothetical protein